LRPPPPPPPPLPPTPTHSPYLWYLTGLQPYRLNRLCPIISYVSDKQTCLLWVEPPVTSAKTTLCCVWLAGTISSVPVPYYGYEHLLLLTSPPSYLPTTSLDTQLRSRTTSSPMHFGSHSRPTVFSPSSSTDSHVHWQTLGIVIYIFLSPAQRIGVGQPPFVIRVDLRPCLRPASTRCDLISPCATVPPIANPQTLSFPIRRTSGPPMLRRTGLRCSGSCAQSKGRAPTTGPSLPRSSE
jgi:hypothetical protein